MKREQCGVGVCEEDAVLYAKRITSGGLGAWEERWFCSAHASEFIRSTDRRWQIKQLGRKKK